MKAYVRCATLAFLCLAGCSQPNNDLFAADGGPSTPLVVGGSTSGTSAAGSSSADSGAGASSNADKMNTGGSAGMQPMPVAGASSTAGMPPTAGGGAADQGGGSGGGGSGGAANPPDPGGAAGTADGGSSNPDPMPMVPVCGNGILEQGEQCDDAGHTGQDGCDANCKVVCSEHAQGALESEDHHCYFGYDQFDFAAAQADCAKRGAHLATIASATENKLVLKFINNSKWIGGLEDVASTQPGTGAYAWITGEPFSYTNWAPQEPNRLDTHCGGSFNQHCYEHCVAILGDGSWADHRCDMPDGYVCEWEPAGTK